MCTCLDLHRTPHTDSCLPLLRVPTNTILGAVAASKCLKDPMKAATRGLIVPLNEATEMAAAETTQKKASRLYVMVIDGLEKAAHESHDESSGGTACLYP